MSEYTPKYDPRDDELGLDVKEKWFPSVSDPEEYEPHGYIVTIDVMDQGWSKTREDAEKIRQEYAIAIANSVHGAELARLRAVEETWIDLVRRLRAAWIEHMRWEHEEGEGLPLRGNIMEVFDEASIAIGAPISNDDGVPVELMPATPACKPTMHAADRTWGWLVKWGPGPLDGAVIDELEDALDVYGERYAAWKAGAK